MTQAGENVPFGVRDFSSRNCLAFEAWSATFSLSFTSDWFAHTIQTCSLRFSILFLTICSCIDRFCLTGSLNGNASSNQVILVTNMLWGKMELSDQFATDVDEFCWLLLESKPKGKICMHLFCPSSLIECVLLGLCHLEWEIHTLVVCC